MTKTTEAKTQEGLTNIVSTSQHTKTIYNVLKYTLLALFFGFIFSLILSFFRWIEN